MLTIKQTKDTYLTRVGLCFSYIKVVFMNAMFTECIVLVAILKPLSVSFSTIK